MRTKKKNLRDHATELVDRVTPHVENARDKAGPALAEAREKAAPMLAEARDKADVLLTEAREKAAPLVAEAREKTGPAIQDARDRFTAEVLPAVTAALAAAGEATEDVRGETKKRGKAVKAALKGEIEAPDKKSHKFRNLLIVLGLGGIVAAVAKKMSAREATTAWQSSYTPPPAPAAAPGPVTPSAPQAGAHEADQPDDEGGASPDVVAADKAAEPHAATTPDNPAEEVDVTDK
jgi:hypothetical protein